MTMDEMQFSAERWQQFWAAYKGEPQQVAGIEELRQHIAQSDPALLTEAASWAQNFRKTPPKPAGPITPELMHRLTAYPASSFNEAFCTSFNNMLAATGFDQHPQAMQMLMA